MKQESNLKPTKKYEIENIDNNRCEVVFFDLDSIEEETRTTEAGEEEVVYKYNSYRQAMSYSKELKSYLNENYTELLNKAKESLKDTLASEIRAIRDKLLEESDKDMAFDRLGIDFPDFEIPSLSLTNIVKFVKTLAEAVKALRDVFKNISDSDMAKYRQELRDITEQEGFPFNVVFPEKPKK